MTEIPGRELRKATRRALPVPAARPGVYKIADDQQMVIDLLEQQHLLLSHGTGFNLPTADHLRMVFLAPVDVLDDAIGRFATFLETYQQ